MRVWENTKKRSKMYLMKLFFIEFLIFNLLEKYLVVIMQGGKNVGTILMKKVKNVVFFRKILQNKSKFEII